MIIDNLNTYCDNPHCFEDTCKGECTEPEVRSEVVLDKDGNKIREHTLDEDGEFGTSL